MTERPILFSGLISPEPNTGCWLWTGAINAKGYGRAGRGEMAHRRALRLAGRSVPPGFEVDHRCNVRCCVNPDHLDIVTHAENIARKKYPTTCPRGHRRFSVGADGKRDCMECGRERNAIRYRERNPEVQRNGRRWLTDDERRGIRALIAQGKSHSQIAPLFNVSVGTVSRVRNANA